MAAAIFLSVSFIVFSETCRTMLQDLFAYLSVLCADHFLAILISTILLALLCPLILMNLEPRSSPGGPRETTTRLAKWSSRPAAVPSVVGHPAIGKRSHEVTEKSFSGKKLPNLTGEPVGRQIWTEGEEGPLDMETMRSLFSTFDPSRNPNAGDKLFRTWAQSRSIFEAPNAEAPRPKTALDAARKGVAFYQTLQTDDGFWAGDYGGPMFLLPGFVIACFVCGVEISELKRRGMVAYLRNHQQEDGGWGTHIEGASTMFGSVLNYVALRLLGESSEEEYIVKARLFIKEHGGAGYTASWAKFWLAILGVYDWRGINSIPPELWMLPYWFPFHPGRLWCHCRMVYLPMSYIYGKRVTRPLCPLTTALREELYVEKYEEINWQTFRTAPVSDIDAYASLSLPMRLLNEILAIYERSPFSSSVSLLRSAGLRFAIDYIHAEDEQTNYVDIGPVNKMLNLVAVWAENPEGVAVKKHVKRLEDYIWMAEDGVKMQGYNGSQLWDTAFAIQAIYETGLQEEFTQCLQRAHDFVDVTQIREDVPDREKYFRHISKGGWPFSTNAHGWPISDCTAEGLKAVLLQMENPKISNKINAERLFDSVHLLLSFQNDDGGWATYELTRGWRWYELLNPSEVFGDIMIDYSYVECTSAVLTALVSFQKQFPEHRQKEIMRAIKNGQKFIQSIQRKDGSWYGSWGCCFTYGTWFGIEGLKAAGEQRESSRAISKACAFLASKQREDGGWGESFLSCLDKKYTENNREGSQVVQTSWALLGLLAGGWGKTEEEKEVLKKGARFLIQRQEKTGDWSQESVSGVFNRTSGITYTSYRNVFPVWALGRFAAEFGDPELL